MKRLLWIALALMLIDTLFNILPWQGQANFEDVKKDYQRSERTFFDRHGLMLAKQRVNPDSRRLDWIVLNDVPEFTRKAIVQVEDKRFYKHSGVDGIALIGLPYEWYRTKKLRGASTLTMQLEGLLEPKSSLRQRSLMRKVRQILKAWRMEWTWSKDEILEAYLNLVTFRGDLEGIRAASVAIFQKEPHGLSPEESYILASLIASPNGKPERIAKKVCQVMHLNDCDPMLGLSNAALSRKPYPQRIEAVAPHYIRSLSQSGPEVYTTLDLDLQRIANEAVADHISSLGLQNVHDAAVLVADYRSGEVLAYVGSSGKYSKAAEVDGVKSLRHAGSTLKPLLYAEAFDERLLTAETLLLDKPLQIQTSSGLYSPQNYDEAYRGVVTVRDALASSLNIPAVRVIDMVGVDRFYSLLERLGFNLASRQTYGHSLALGSLDVSLWQLVKAYGVLARGGSDWRMTLEKSSGSYPKPKNFFQSESTEAISRILSDKESRAGTFALENMFATPYWAAVKTGASKDMSDSWCIGYSDKYVVGVWVGNFDDGPMWSVSGVTGAAPIWRRVMDHLHAKASVFETLPFHPPVEALPPKPVLKERSSKMILYPLKETVIALDPDLPEKSQILVFESAEVLPKEFHWRLDEQRRAEGFVKLIEMKSGKHLLEIVDDEGRVVDSVTFELRGSAAKHEAYSER